MRALPKSAQITRHETCMPHRPMLIPFLPALALLVFALPALAQSQSYPSRAACEQADRLTSEQCGFAFANARAEFEEKAPRYRGRQDCVRAHKACSAQLVAVGGMGGAGREAAIYVPRFEGVSITERNGQPAACCRGPARRQAASRRARSTGRMTRSMAASLSFRIQPRGAGGGRGNDPQWSPPYVKRGDRDDTIKMDLPVRDPRDPNATGLFIDKDGVEWYRRRGGAEEGLPESAAMRTWRNR